MKSAWNRILIGWLLVVPLLSLLAGWSRAQAPKKEAAKTPALNQKIVDFCVENLGEKVGDGGCSSLVDEAFKKVLAKPRSKLPAPKPPLKADDFVWGRLLGPKETIFPGDVMQFRDIEIKIVEANSFFSFTYPHHTAVVYKVHEKNRYTVLHQNVGGADKSLAEKQLVQEEIIDLGHKSKGSVWFYRPLEK